MINLDMVGRLRKDTLDLHGVGTSPAFKALAASAAADAKLTLKTHEGGFGPSDHSAFYGVSLPILFLFTGVHSDYHRTSDTAEKLNYEGEERILQFLRPVVKGLVNTPERVTFSRVPASVESPGSRPPASR